MEHRLAEESVPIKTFMPGHVWIQLFKYGCIGLATNACGYLLYLWVTWLGAPPKIVMTLLYLAGATLGFLGNRQLTFAHQGNVMSASLRYMLAHTVGYFLNLAILLIFVDHSGYPHQIVQAIAIVVVAGYLFVAFKLFVFRNPSR